MKFKVVAFALISVLLLFISYSIGHKTGYSSKSYLLSDERMQQILDINDETMQQMRDKIDQLVDEYQKKIGPYPMADTSSDDWRPLKDDLGLMLFTDRFGTRRATLYVFEGSKWRPVAVQGFSELGPKFLPLGD